MKRISERQKWILKETHEKRWGVVGWWEEVLRIWSILGNSFLFFHWLPSSTKKSLIFQTVPLKILRFPPGFRRNYCFRTCRFNLSDLQISPLEIRNSFEDANSKMEPWEFSNSSGQTKQSVCLSGDLVTWRHQCIFDCFPKKCFGAQCQTYLWLDVYFFKFSLTDGRTDAGDVLEHRAPSARRFWKLKSFF